MTDIYPVSLQSLLQKNMGGALNTRGVIYQAKYVVWRILNDFIRPENEHLVFIPEGIEDLDCYCQISGDSSNEFTQVKCLDDKLGADKFAEEILPNFIRVYENAPGSRFKVVSNQRVTGGVLEKLREASIKNTDLQDRAFEHWAIKIRGINPHFNDHQIKDFLSKIKFEPPIDEALLVSESHKILIEHFDFVQGNEAQIYAVLFKEVLDWSRYKKKVGRADLLTFFQLTKDENLENQALRYGWISEILFEKSEDPTIESAYFEGKPARPQHIAANLPIARSEWESQISDSIRDFDITLIKSSSGQGKSTLAWQVANAMKSQGFRVYELKKAPPEGLHDLVLFIKSRLKFCLPLIAIDGLNKQVSEWSDLAAAVQDLRGVKFLITTREEDWFRYGGAISRLSLKPINIKLSRKEAEAIFQAFKKRNLVHPNMRAWQIAWDEVKRNELLLEYVYLLTQGQMLHQRLADQLALMRTERENHVKKEVLRLVAMANVLNFRLPTSNLSTHLESKFGNQFDKNDLFQSLKNEYHIQVEGTEFIEGLHLVRSKHLNDLLHENISQVDTLITLVPMLEAGTLSDFASRSTQLLMSSNEKERFLNVLAEEVCEKSYSEIVDTIVGIWGADAHQHWVENKDAYDEVGAADLLFYIIKKTPFGGFDESLFDLNKQVNKDFQTNLDKITDYDPAQSNVAYFLKHLQQKLVSFPLKLDLAGSMDLEMWFQRFGLTMNLRQRLTWDRVKNAVENLELGPLGQILRGVFLIDEPFFFQIYEKFGDKILQRLLRETNTLHIKSTDSEILTVNYLPDWGQMGPEQSTKRLQLIAYCLPFYKTYQIEMIRPAAAFIPSNLVESSDEKFQKIGTWDNLMLKHVPWVTRANGFWISTIEKKYEFSTHFEWLEYWSERRKIFVEWLRQSCRLLETGMNRKRDIEEKTANWRHEKHKLLQVLEEEKNIRDDRYFSKKTHKEIIENITDWGSLTYAVVAQFSTISNENSQRLLVHNARELYQKLPKMQVGFEAISKITGNDFGTNTLLEQELNAHQYFSEIIRFYCENYLSKRRLIANVRQEVKRWIETHSRTT